jgi:flagellar biosynthesis anti-sigma factor FlgM
MMGKINIDRLSGPDPIRAEFGRDVKGAANEAGITVDKRGKVSEDKLEISSRATEVTRLVDQIKAMPDVRAERVDALREMVETGVYNPSSDQIAAAILDEERS